MDERSARPRLRSFAAAAALGLLALARPAVSQPSPARDTYAMFASLQRHPGLVRAVVLASIPSNTETMIAISPAAFAAMPHRRIVRRRDSAAIVAELHSLAKSLPSSGSRALDVRSSLTFEDAAGRPLLVVAFDGDGTRALLGDRHVYWDDLKPRPVPLGGSTR